jgi:hypothetical protein
MHRPSLKRHSYKPSAMNHELSAMSQPAMNDEESASGGRRGHLECQKPSENVSLVGTFSYER